MSILLSAASCQKKDSASAAQEYLNVAYGLDTAQKMDIHLPAGRTMDSTKVIVLIHGGAWNNGDKQDFSTSISILKQKLPQYAIANINYRLATQIANHFPTQERDVQAAVSFLYSRRSEYNISDKFILLGASAGGHLALLQSYKHTKPVKVKAVISFFGPSDMAEMYNTQTNSYYQFALQLLIGGTPTANTSVYQQSSPIYFAGAQSPPTLLLHGGKDGLVTSHQSVALKNKLTAAGATADLVLYPNEGHGWYGATLNDSFNRIASFLNSKVL